MNPFRLAKRIKKAFGPNVDIYQLMKHYGIILLEVDSRDFIAGYRHIKRCKVIQINQNLEENLKRCVLWHELGHALMHGATNTIHADTIFYNRSRDEFEANLFALYLLSYSYDIDERLLQAAPRNRDIMTYSEAHKLLCRCIER